jgi:lysophospholipase L1-like esterase
VKIDDGKFAPANGLGTTGWQWVKLTSISLKPGGHNLTMTYREDGALLDKIAMTTYPFGPSGLEAAQVDAQPQRKVSRHAAWRRDDTNSREAHKQLVAKTKQGKIDVYFQGDSITRRWGASDYPTLLAHWKKTFHGWNAANFAWGGDNTHHILWRMQNGELDVVSPKVICLQAGANNLPRRGPAKAKHVDDVVGGIQAIIDAFRTRFPDVPIVLTAMFPRDQNGELADTIDAINQNLESISQADDRIHWININRQLVGSAGKLLPSVSSDGLHLEQRGYEIWATALRPVLKQILGPPAQLDHAPPPSGNPGL